MNVIDTGSIGDNTLVAARAGIKYEVYAVVVGPAAACTTTFKSATTAISPVLNQAAGMAMIGGLGVDSAPLFSTAAGAALVCTVATAACPMQVYYRERH